MRGLILRILAYFVMGALWEKMGWPAWSFVVAALLIMFGIRFIGREYPFGRKI